MNAWTVTDPLDAPCEHDSLQGPALGWVCYRCLHERAEAMKEQFDRREAENKQLGEWFTKSQEFVRQAESALAESREREGAARAALIRLDRIYRDQQEPCERPAWLDSALASRAPVGVWLSEEEVRTVRDGATSGLSMAHAGHDCIDCPLGIALALLDGKRGGA